MMLAHSSMVRRRAYVGLAVLLVWFSVVRKIVGTCLSFRENRVSPTRCSLSSMLYVKELSLHPYLSISAAQQSYLGPRTVKELYYSLIRSQAYKHNWCVDNRDNTRHLRSCGVAVYFTRSPIRVPRTGPKVNATSASILMG